VRTDEKLTAFLELEAAIRSRHCHLKYKLISRVQDEELHEN